MKSFLRQLTISSVSLAVLAQGQNSPPTVADENIRPVELVPLKPEPLNRVSLSYSMGLNITADFTKFGGAAAFSNPGPLTGGTVNRTYDNGYNLVDITGNDHGPGYQNTTWNWGYQNSGSLQGNQLVFSSSSAAADASSKDNSNDPQSGVELSYGRELFRKGNWRFGLEGGLGFTSISISDHRPMYATVSTITDRYTIPSGVTIPPAPHNGTFDGPGAVIGSEPSSRSTSVTARGATVDGSRLLDANVYSLRIGPYAAVPLNDRFKLLFNGGVYLAMGDSRFSYRETVTIPGVGSVHRESSGSETDYLIGGYVGGNVEYALSKDLALFVGAQFLSAGRPVNHEQGKEAILNLNQSLIVSIGASYSF